ncbi:MAG: hypothetical protein MZV49_20105 [Rhodopseudomonas palustris]|nr:hypothetical protein [Rhodopseudomonas palustris]
MAVRGGNARGVSRCLMPEAGLALVISGGQCRSVHAERGSLPAGTLPAMASSCAGRLEVTVADNAAFLSRPPDLRSGTNAGSRCLQPDGNAGRGARIAKSRSSAAVPGGERDQPVSACRNCGASLAPSAPSTTSTDGLAQQPTLRAPQPLDLFSDRSGTFSG